MADERLSIQQLELLLKQQELRLKELEVKSKERGVKDSKWLNPVFIGLLATTVGLFGNVIVTRINSTNTQELERFRTQSNLILEAIQTNGDMNAACRNLVFFASLGLIEDRNHTVAGACPGNPQGVPSLPSGKIKPYAYFGETYFFPLKVQIVDDNGAPISDAKVEASLVPSDTPLQFPPEFMKLSSDADYRWLFFQTSTYCTTTKDGNCFLGMAPSGRFIAVLAKKNGYSGNRTNMFFTGSSIVVVLQEQPRTR